MKMAIKLPKNVSGYYQIKLPFLINATHYDIFITFSPISWHVNGIFLAPYHVKACPTVPHFCNKHYVANSAILGNVYFI
jgi:hypothetical protein